MNGIICDAPRGGGSAGTLARYLFGYTMSSKADSELTKAERKAQYRDLHVESLTRDDLGVGSIWEPKVGTSNGRPAAVLVCNVTSFTSADQELESWGAVGKHARIQEPTLHLIFSFSPDETKTLTNKQMVQAARDAIVEMGLGDHAQSLSLHSDEPHGHIHAAVAAVNPHTLHAWERYRDQYRISWGCRKSEIKNDLRHDRGLYVVEIHNGVKTIRETTKPERKAWEREAADARLDHETVRAQGEYAAFETPEHYAETIETAIRERSEAMVAAGLAATYADAHRVAAAYGGRLMQQNGQTYIEVRERLSEDERAAIAADMKAKKLLDGPYDAARVEAPRTKATGNLVPIDAAELGIKAPFQNVEDAELQFAQLVLAQPDYVSRVLTYVDGHGLVDRNAVDKYIASRVTDPVLIAELGDHVIANDQELELKSVDSKHRTYVRKDLQMLQDAVMEDARQLTYTADPGYNAAAFASSVQKLESDKRKEQISKGQEPNFTVADEQRALCEGILKNRLVWSNGEAGSGKTTAMAVLKNYAALTGRPIIGLATGQSAARKLGREANIKTLNLTKLRLDESHGRKVLPANAIVIIDETSMTSYRALRVLFDLAKKRNATIAGIGDSAQIPNIEAGSPHDNLRDLTRRAGTYFELKTVRRQKGALAWLAPEVEKAGEAIRTGDADGVEHFVEVLEVLDAHAVLEQCETRDDVIRAAAEWYATEPNVETIVTCKDRMAAAHGSMLVREALGITGGTPFKFRRGTLKLATGDRIQFGKNDHRLQIDNNDLGTVTKLTWNPKNNSWAITAKLDRDGREVTWNPNVYTHVTHGYFITAHKGQGQSVPRCGAIMDKMSDPNTAHVQFTRSTDELRAFYSKSNFENAQALGKHLGSRIEPARDYLRLEDVIAQTGGPNTVWARHALKAAVDSNDQWRRQWVREQRERREALENQRLIVITTIRTEMRATNDPEKKAALLRRLHRETKTIDAQQGKNAKQTFVAWMCDRKVQDDRDSERMGVARLERAQAMAKETKPETRQVSKRSSPERGWVR